MISPNNVSMPNLSDPRLCHLLTWSYYDGYGFYVDNNNEYCYIKNVEPNSPAQTGGLRANDRIIEVDGKPVKAKDKAYIAKQVNLHKNFNPNVPQKKTLCGSKPVSKYLNLLVADPNTYAKLASQKVKLSSKNKNLNVQQCYTPPEQPKTVHPPIIQPPIKPYQPPYQPPNDYFDRISLTPNSVNLGFELVSTNLAGPNAVGDYYIGKVDEGSPAYRSGLRKGERLIEVDGVNVRNKTFEQVIQMIDQSKFRDKLRLLVFTNNNTTNDFNNNYTGSYNNLSNSYNNLSGSYNNLSSGYNNIIPDIINKPISNNYNNIVQNKYYQKPIGPNYFDDNYITYI